MNRTATGLVVLILVLALAYEFWPEARHLSEMPLQDEPALTDNELGLDIVGALPRLFVAHVSHDGTLFGIDDHFVFRSDDGGQSFRRLGRFPERGTSLLKRATDPIARSKIVRHFRRYAGPQNLVVLRSGTIIVVGAGGIFRSADGGKTFSVALDLDKEGLHLPMPSAVAVTKDDLVYFGEYVADDQAHAIRVLEGLNDGRDWRVAHTFAAGEVRHIHSIQYDVYRDRLWICTGDSDAQSKLLYSDDGFNTIATLGQGTQDWRIVSLIVTRDHLYWGSDNDRPEGADIFRWNFRAAQLEHLHHIGKPAYFSTILQDGTMVIGTVYEPESNYSASVRPEPVADLWLSRDGLQWTRTYQFPARVEDGGLKTYRPKVLFPSGLPLRHLIMTLADTEDYDRTSFIIALE